MLCDFILSIRNRLGVTNLNVSLVKACIFDEDEQAILIKKNTVCRLFFICQSKKSDKSCTMRPRERIEQEVFVLTLMENLLRSTTVLKKRKVNPLKCVLLETNTNLNKYK